MDIVFHHSQNVIFWPTPWDINDTKQAGAPSEIPTESHPEGKEESVCRPLAGASPAEPTAEIKLLRMREKISQPVLARPLNVSPSAVKHWEIGDKQPNGAALKLLNLIFTKGLAVLV